MIEVQSFTDRKGNKVRIGDTIGYFYVGDDKILASGKVSRITKAGYHISIYSDGSNHPWYKPWVEKIR